MQFLKGVTFFSFLGYLIEGAYQKLTCGTFKKPNFSWLPFKPMYGIAAMLLLGLKTDSRWMRLAGFVLIPTGVEYISGYWLRQDFGLRYWDYSQEKGNIDGLVCPRYLLYWGALSYLLVEQIGPRLKRAYKRRQRQWEPFLQAAALLFATDVQCNLWRRYHDKRKRPLNK